MLLEEIKTIRNPVAKFSQGKSGAGQHVAKQGKKAPRQKQKRAWKKEIQSDF